MKQLALAVVVTCMLVACTPRDKDEKPVEHPKAITSNSAPSTEAAPNVISASLAYNIGDVEQGIHLQAAIADESKAPNIEIKELADSNKLIRTSTVTISPPFPEHLWIRFFITMDKLGPDYPVVLKGNIGFGEQCEKPIQPFKFVAYKRATLDEIKVDLMAHLQGSPDSVLIGSKAEAILMPAGTDPKTINPDTTQGTPDTTSTLYSNPLRINFKRAQDGK